VCAHGYSEKSFTTSAQVCATYGKCRAGGD
jgi:hypothetical protein